MSTQDSNRMLDPLFASRAMCAIFSDHATVQAMLDFEAALARAQARTGVIPATVVRAIESKCRVELFNLDTLAQAAARAGNTAIPLIKELTGSVAQDGTAAMGFVHWGATSQDVMDTGLVLQLRSALDAIDKDLAQLSAVLAQLAETHKHTPLAGRTWMQQAVPITFGLKAAGWLSAIERHRQRVTELRPRVLVLQFGGAVGTLAALGDRAMQVAAALAEDLQLALPDLPWHTHRDRVTEAATTLGLIAGTLGKIARDVSLLMQAEIGEAIEPSEEGRGGSSTMPHKRNPVSCAVALAAATRVPALVSTMLSAMVQEHERGLGGWPAEWETLPEIFRLTAGALEHMTHALAGLDVRVDRMRANLDVTQGQILAEAISMALAKHIGRAPAQELMQQACRRASAEGRHLRAVLEEETTVLSHLSPSGLDRLFDPNQYTGVADQFIERALAAWRGRGR